MKIQTTSIYHNRHLVFRVANDSQPQSFTKNYPSSSSIYLPGGGELTFSDFEVLVVRGKHRERRQYRETEKARRIARS